MAKADKKSPEFAEQREALKQLSGEIKEAEKQLNDVLGAIQNILPMLPNIPDPSVPEGKGEEDNVVVRVWGDKPTYSFTPKAHWDIGTALGILDFERAAKLSGARFTVLMGTAARLERALISFMLDLHTREHGYTEVLPPFLVKDSALFGTGQLPKFAEDLFKTHKADPERAYDLYLIPTAEVPVTNLHADEILDIGEWDAALRLIDETLSEPDRDAWKSIFADIDLLEEHFERLPPVDDVLKQPILHRCWKMALVDGQASDIEETIHDRIARRLGINEADVSAWRISWTQEAYEFAEMVAGLAAAAVLLLLEMLGRWGIFRSVLPA